ncbi:MAG TPA: POTRA domain-containing protein [Leptospiraceae bacterium]|nr:POTRA domain-containing protein [Leptospiraceae bacterium]HNF13195.1 POTRA domain-containing protein [Leptospiraceae bacterium]HNF24610.1 POTRA domain-containing protein [Leptospiraceae bacterium]HNN06632.1 POTRA domain-containing protein [Leptospiraceae bacterium]HNO23881.1 POTRA domain-containing protein [Leptospiraceae bacterium]
MLGLFFVVLFQLFITPSKLISDRSQYIGKKISDIKFSGNKNTPSDDILSVLEMRKGKTVTEKMLNDDLKALFAMGAFYNIDVQAELDPEGNVIIIVEVKERPRVEEIEFIGADEVFPSDMKDKMPLKEGEIITPEKVNATKEVIMKKYKDEGYFHAYIKAELGEINPKTNLVKVKFIIDEGDEIPVAKINILGTQNIDPSELMQILDLKEAGLIESGHFKEAAYETDKQKIVAYMKTKGYRDADLVPEGTGWEIHWENPKLKDKRAIIVNFKVFEGDQYFFNGYSLSHDLTEDGKGNPVFLNKENKENLQPDKSKWKPIYEAKFLENLFEFTDSDTGVIFDEGKFQRDKGVINELYSAKGYIFAQVVTRNRTITLDSDTLSSYESCSVYKGNQTECEEQNKKLNIKKLRELLTKKPEMKGKKFEHVDFIVRENYLAYIENIIIKGNKKTQDRVIRRELLFKPGDLFNSALVNRSRERIFNLGYFKEVNFNSRPGSDETKMNLIIDLLEQPTGTISMGGGYGTISGFSIFTELGENNLNGTGQKISGRVEFGPLRRFFQLSWTEPWIYNRPWALTLSMFYSSRTINVGAASITDSGTGAIKERASYDREGIGFSIGVAHRIFINWTHFHRYSPSFFQSTNATSLADDSIRAEVNRGWQFRSEITNGIGYDSRDNIFTPTSGLNAYLAVSNVGQYLGGQSHFDRYNPVFEFYHSWFDYTFGGMIRSNALRRWKVVQEFRSSSVFTYERPPKFGRAAGGIGNLQFDEIEKQRNPFIQQQDLQFLGGYESLRGWNFQDVLYPREWRNGANHRMLFSSELRFPIEPSLLWLVAFLDAGALYEEVGRWTGTRRDNARNYQTALWQTLGTMSPADAYLRANFEPYSLRRLTPDQNPFEKDNPENLVLKVENISLQRLKFSWGLGLRIQIPVLPLRLYFAQKLYYQDGGLHPYPSDPNFTFVFGIGDFRF